MTCALPRPPPPPNPSKMQKIKYENSRMRVKLYEKATTTKKIVAPSLAALESAVEGWVRSVR